MWGQSDPNSTRSAPIHSTTDARSSSQNGLIQTWRRKISTGSSANQPRILRSTDRSLRNRSGRNSAPFSTDATRRLGNFVKWLASTIDSR